MIKAHGAIANVVPGSRDHCADVCRAKVNEEGKYYANHVYNPFFYEGTKTYIYEVYEQLHRMPQNIFIPLGNGTLFLGAVFGLEHLVESGISHSAALNRAALEFVRATAQSNAMERLLPHLTEEELGYYRRGRNAGHLNFPKNARPAEYRRATGMEVLFGFLHLAGRPERAKELFTVAYSVPQKTTKDEETKQKLVDS